MRMRKNVILDANATSHLSVHLRFGTISIQLIGALFSQTRQQNSTQNPFKNNILFFVSFTLIYSTIFQGLRGKIINTRHLSLTTQKTAGVFARKLRVSACWCGSYRATQYRLDAQPRAHGCKLFFYETSDVAVAKGEAVHESIFDSWRISEHPLIAMVCGNGHRPATVFSHH